MSRDSREASLMKGLSRSHRSSGERLKSASMVMPQEALAKARNKANRGSGHAATGGGGGGGGRRGDHANGSGGAGGGGARVKRSASGHALGAKDRGTARGRRRRAGAGDGDGEWTELTVESGPAVRYGQSLVAVGTRLYVFGGVGEKANYFNDLFEYDAVDGAWRELEVKSGVAPKARYGHTAVVVKKRIFVFGGEGKGGLVGYLNDLHRFDTETNTWKELKCSGTPPSPRHGHTACVIGHKMYVFGGEGRGYSKLNDLHVLDTEAKVWTQIRPNSELPKQRERHTAASVGSKMYVFGGVGKGGKRFNDTWCFDAYTNKWSSLSGGAAPAPRDGHGTGVLGTDIYIFGGLSGGEWLQDVYRWDTQGGRWHEVDDDGEAPRARCWHSMTAVRNRLYVFGGWDTDRKCLSDLHVLELLEDDDDEEDDELFDDALDADDEDDGSAGAFTFDDDAADSLDSGDGLEDDGFDVIMDDDSDGDGDGNDNSDEAIIDDEFAGFGRGIVERRTSSAVGPAPIALSSSDDDDKAAKKDKRAATTTANGRRSSSNANGVAVTANGHHHDDDDDLDDDDDDDSDFDEEERAMIARRKALASRVSMSRLKASQIIRNRTASDASDGGSGSGGGGGGGAGSGAGGAGGGAVGSARRASTLGTPKSSAYVERRVDELFEGELPPLGVEDLSSALRTLDATQGLVSSVLSVGGIVDMVLRAKQKQDTLHQRSTGLYQQLSEQLRLQQEQGGDEADEAELVRLMDELRALDADRELHFEGILDAVEGLGSPEDSPKSTTSGNGLLSPHRSPGRRSRSPSVRRRGSVSAGATGDDVSPVLRDYVKWRQAVKEEAGPLLVRLYDQMAGVSDLVNQLNGVLGGASDRGVAMMDAVLAEANKHMKSG